MSRNWRTENRLQRQTFEREQPSVMTGVKGSYSWVHSQKQTVRYRRKCGHYAIMLPTVFTGYTEMLYRTL